MFPRAFDQIRKKVPKGSEPAGCREKDRIAYNLMLLAIHGVNAAEFFPRGIKEHVFLMGSALKGIMVRG